MQTFQEVYTFYFKIICIVRYSEFLSQTDSLVRDISARKYVFSNLSFEKLRSMLATVTGRVKNIVYSMTTSGKQTDISIVMMTFDMSSGSLAFWVKELRS